MAALDRPTEATYAVHEMVTVDTTDRRDHTFCGVVFPVRCKQTLPVNHIVINSISVRGRLGPLTVWVNKDSGVKNYDNNSQDERYSFRAARLSGGGKTVSSISMKKKDWTKIYEKNHKPSFQDYCELSLANPIILKPGEVRGIYVHSTLRSDEAIVYDNRKAEKTHDDDFISIYPGRAHVSERTFGTIPIWGWGNAWRDNREFVGRLNYGVVYRLWNPVQHLSFGSRFQTATKTLFGCQRRDESPFSNLPDDCIFYILNMCRWDWVEDDAKEILKEQRKRVRALSLAKLQLQKEFETKKIPDSSKEAAATTVATTATTCTEINKTHDIVKNDQDLNDTDEMNQSDSDNEEEEEYDSSDEDGYLDHTASSTFYHSYMDEFAQSEDEDDESENAGTERTNRASWMLNRLNRIQAIRTLVYDTRANTNNSDSS